jgi:hypothetical protein
MASFQYQCTLNQLLVKTAEFSRRIDLLQSGFFCSHPRFALLALSALSRIDRSAIMSKLALMVTVHNVCLIAVINVYRFAYPPILSETDACTSDLRHELSKT